MRSFRFVVTSLCMLAAFGGVSPANEVAREYSQPCPWQKIGNSLEDSEALFTTVTAASSKESWVAGWEQIRRGSIPQIRYWDGISWAQESITSFEDSVKLGESAISSDGTPIVSGQIHDGRATKPVILRRDSTSGQENIWTPMPVEETAYSNDLIDDITTLENHAGWAAGTSYERGGSARTLLLRSRGDRWKVTGPRLEGHWFSGIDAHSEDDVWAVGGNNGRTFTMHFDGDRWSRVKSPNFNLKFHSLNGVAVENPNSVWAVGTRKVDAEHRVPLVMHWNGTRWRLQTDIPETKLGISTGAYLEDVVVNNGEIVATGNDGSHAYGLMWTRLEGKWTVDPPPEDYRDTVTLYDVASAHDGSLFTVGLGRYMAGADSTWNHHIRYRLGSC